MKEGRSSAENAYPIPILRIPMVLHGPVVFERALDAELDLILFADCESYLRDRSSNDEVTHFLRTMPEIWTSGDVVLFLKRAMLFQKPLFG